MLDGELWLTALDREVREAFAGGLCYVQKTCTTGSASGSSGRRPSRPAIARWSEAEWEWSAEGLRIAQRRAATVRHPVAGAEVWFNPADQFHRRSRATRPPRSCTRSSNPRSSGGPTPDAYVKHIQRRALGIAVDVPWRPGDVRLIDNVLVAHGRRPFEGERRVLVAMSG